MIKNKPTFQKKRTILFTVLIAVILFSVCLSFILVLHSNIKQRGILEVTDRYMTFESKVERLIYSNVILLQGYGAYIKSNPYLDEDRNYLYLNNLLSDSSEYIRNIGVIKDTTIIWNYPKASNALAIGVDLSKIELQRDLVLNVKANLKPVMQGPLTLVQGGTGFIVRLPIVREGTGYWGQISIVLNSERFLGEISSYAESSGLNIAIFNQQNNAVPILGSVGPDGNSKLVFEMDPAFINWKIHVYLPNVWSENLLLFMLLTLFSAGVSVFVGILAYKYLKSNYKIFNMSIHDSLSGLYNRHFLDEYQSIVLSAAKRRNHNVGILLMDLNHFKKVNDTYGHDVGDRVLVETSRILMASTRTNETVFRLGGDEFLLILPEAGNTESLQSVKARILKRFEQDFCISGYPIKMSLSIGCALFPEDGSDIDTLLHMADKRMYLEKPKDH